MEQRRFYSVNSGTTYLNPTRGNLKRGNPKPYTKPRGLGAAVNAAVNDHASRSAHANEGASRSAL